MSARLEDSAVRRVAFPYVVALIGLRTYRARATTPWVAGGRGRRSPQKITGGQSDPRSDLPRSLKELSSGHPPDYLARDGVRRGIGSESEPLPDAGVHQVPAAILQV